MILQKGWIRKYILQDSSFKFDLENLGGILKWKLDDSEKERIFPDLKKYFDDPKDNPQKVFDLCANYLKGMPNIKEFRGKLVRLNTLDEITEVLDEIVSTYTGFNFEKSPIELIDYHQNCPIG